MNDAYETLKTAFLLLIGIITVGILAYFGKRTNERVDSLKETAITREELTKALDKIEARQGIRHGENGDKLDAIVREIREDRKRTEDHREKFGATPGDIRTDIAVLKSESLFDDAGRVRR